jgi:chromosomal replication initiation ATPase DnaA
MEKRGTSLEEPILFYIAENIQSNVRELEGALNKKIFLELEVETDKHWPERA